VQFVSDTSISFPPNDIASITVQENGMIRFVLSFMGLLGISSPLPHYFTEYGTKYEKDGSALADFLAIFNHRIYVLFYQAWKKYRLVNGSVERDAFGLLQKIAMLAGLYGERFYTHTKLAAYAGIFAGSCRNAEGLRTLIADYFQAIPVTVKQWMPRWAPVKDLKKLGIDAVLGIHAMIGTHILDRGGTFRLILGPLEKDTFQMFQPDTPNIALLKEMVTGYLTDPLEFDIEVQLKPAALTAVILGEDTAQIGISGSCGTSTGTTEAYSIVIA
jgi:type VI secretion system protein ImpH